MLRRTWRAGLLAGALLMASVTSGSAQTPGNGFGPGPFRASPPSGGGVGLMVVDRDQDRDQLLANLRLQECEPRFLGVTTGGRWLAYVPGAPDFVNRVFPTALGAGEPFFVTCTGVRPDVRLDESDNGAAVTLKPGDRVRVVLESNASTGFAWIEASAPAAAVLVPVGEPFYVASSSGLLGAPGHQVFDYQAVAAGTTSVSLDYERAFESVPPASTWSVNVTVQ
jgi:inhibitor of cysteine peptidase